MKSIKYYQHILLIVLAFTLVFLLAFQWIQKNTKENPRVYENSLS